MAEQRRGKLKIFLGYVAGVGKTFSMLEYAHAQKKAGIDVVVGYVLTHGRMETQRLLQGLEEIPPMVVDYKGTRFQEVDVNAIIQRNPDAVLIDELAHTNIPGMRHPKRYKDIEDVLSAGIDVYTTLNIQHIESLHDAVWQATGVEIKERVPDTILDTADEVELIDLPVDELLTRLREGKVYVPEQAVRAIEKFFRKETLLLLRELALRKAASLVDASRTESSHALGAIKKPLALKLLASVGPSPFSERVIRACKRLADLIKAEWHVVSVETIESKLAPKEVREMLQKHLDLARQLGATVVVIPGESIAEAILRYAKTQSITQIVIGHSLRPWYKKLFQKSPVDELILSDTKHDIYVISSSIGSVESENEQGMYEQKKRCQPFSLTMKKLFFVPVGLILFLVVALNILASFGIETYPCLTYLLFLGVFSVFLEPISYTMFVFLIMCLQSIKNCEFSLWPAGEHVLFAVSVIGLGFFINQLMNARKKALRMALMQNEELHSLFSMSRDLVASINPEQVLIRFNARLKLFFDAEAILLVQEQDIVRKIGKIDNVPFSYIEETAARWAMKHKEKAGCNTSTLPSAQGVWYPLFIRGEPLGALGIYCKNPVDLEARAALIESFVNLMTLSLDRK